MSFDVNAFLASLLVSSVGFVLLVYGRKMQRIPHVGVGLVLLVYPYFVGTVLWTLLPAALLIGLLWVVVRAGY
ncbi:MAG TPA: hypothetical protein VFQ61_34560 [Polyangiaceae bacterium]|nr:hypothetical protein [Polyangiaceae bacterium]